VPLDRIVRRLVPSAARLTYNPLFKVVVNSFDVLPRLAFREFAVLPPNHLRIRVGVGNRILGNQVQFVAQPIGFWLHFMQAGICRLDSTIVDIGCGCGRYAQFLRDYRYKAERFSGRYIGIDVDIEMLEWCRRNFDEQRFTFHQSTDASRAYHAPGSRADHYRLPVSDNNADFVFGASLLTHLLEPALVNYCRESFRVLKPGGHLVLYFYSMDHPPPTLGDRHTFRFQLGNAHVENLALPEAAVAYREAFLVSILRDAGFQSVDVQTMTGDRQPILLCRK